MQFNHTCLKVTTADSAVEGVFKHKPVVILIDHNVPDIASLNEYIGFS